MSMTVALITLGCPKNVVEGEHMAGILRAQGFMLTTDLASAECAVVHTCSFIGDARAESSRVIRMLLRRKRAGLLAKVFVTGCFVQDAGGKMARLFPGVDGFMGTGMLASLGNFVSAGSGFLLGPAGGLLESSAPRLLSSPLPSAYLRVAEGCNHRCSFCTIPRFRGRYVSRSLRSVMDEAAQLVDAGIREIIVIAQDVTAYGRDLSGRSQLATLVRRLARIRDLRWIRLMYAYPSTVTDELLDLMSEEEKVCRYIDIPLQHVSDPVLVRMRRPRGVRAVVERIARRVPGIALRTAFIAGFPGETAADSENLQRFIAEGWFEHCGVFAYSDQPRAASSRLGSPVPAETARHRRAALLREQRRVVASRNRSRIGSVQEVLVEGAGQKRYNTQGDFVVGRTRFQAPEVDTVVHAAGKAAPGSFVRVRITGSRGYDLVGNIL